MAHSKQAMFNKAYRGVVKQGCLATSYTPNAGTMCVYYVTDGKHKGARCAWGHVLTLPQAKSCPFGPCNARRHAEYCDRLGYNADELKFGRELQLAHDRSSTLGEFTTKMRQIAKKYQLTIPTLVRGKELVKKVKKVK